MLEQTDLKNRVIPDAKRPVGRPPNTTTPKPEQPFVPALDIHSVPSCVCPVCDRSMDRPPRVLRVRPDGSKDCSCSLNGCEFVYRPPSVRPK